MGEPSGTRQGRDDMALMDPFGFNFYNGIMRQMVHCFKIPTFIQS